MILVLMIVLAVFLLLHSTIQLQQSQHLLYDHLESSAQVLAAVGFSQWRNMDESRATMPQIQRRVEGVVTQIPGSNQRTVALLFLLALSVLLVLLIQLYYDKSKC